MRITDEWEAMLALGALLCGGTPTYRWHEEAPILKQRIKREWRRKFIREQCIPEHHPDDKIFARLIR
tara:strand:- start:730 stop:930 length:201 start_codon:yes stop_codon:yes gene_type:complete